MTSFAQVIGEPDAFRPAVTMSAEFAEIWLDEVTRLYLLAFLLTAEKAFAEECFAGAMDDYVRSPAAVASAWARGPGRIGVIRRAVHLIRPLPKSVHSWSYVQGRRPLLSPSHQPFSAITSLGSFERFVLVLSVLEGYSEEECACLLECDPADVRCSRDLANRLTSAFEGTDEFSPDCDALPTTAALIHRHCAMC